jgi:hypothetical protein
MLKDNVLRVSIAKILVSGYKIILKI